MIQARISSRSGVRRCRKTSPLRPSNAQATTLLAWTSSPTLVRSNIAGTSKLQMWLYLSAKCGRQPTSCFEKEVPAHLEHTSRVLLIEAITAPARTRRAPTLDRNPARSNGAHRCPARRKWPSGGTAPEPTGGRDPPSRIV